MVAADEHGEEDNLSCSSCDYDEHAYLSMSEKDLTNTDSEGNNCRLLAQSQQKCLPNLVAPCDMSYLRAHRWHQKKRNSANLVSIERSLADLSHFVLLCSLVVLALSNERSVSKVMCSVPASG